MHHVPFFPDGPGTAGLVFAWACYGIVLVGTITGAITDQRSGRIPNYLTVALCVAGLVMNGIRGAWLASLGHGVWLWAEPSVGLGILDGVLFGMAGFGLAFALFFLQWLLGVCGGGDLKLFAALGAWVGWTWAVGLLFVTLLCVVVIVFVRGVGRMMRGKPVGFQRPPTNAKKAKNAAVLPEPAATRRRSRAMDTIYAPSMALSVAFTLLWVWRFDLGIAQQPSPKTDVVKRIETEHMR